MQIWAQTERDGFLFSRECHRLVRVQIHVTPVSGDAPAGAGGQTAGGAQGAGGLVPAVQIVVVLPADADVFSADGDVVTQEPGPTGGTVRFRVALGALDAGQTVTRMLGVKLAAGPLGSCCEMTLAAACGEGSRTSEAVRLSFTRLDRAANAAQVRRREITRELALRSTKPALNRALALCEKGRYERAVAMLTRVAARNARFADGDPAQVSMIAQLEAQAAMLKREAEQARMAREEVADRLRELLRLRGWLMPPPERWKEDGDPRARHPLAFLQRAEAPGRAPAQAQAKAERAQRKAKRRALERARGLKARQPERPAADAPADATYAEKGPSPLLKVVVAACGVCLGLWGLKYFLAEPDLSAEAEGRPAATAARVEAERAVTALAGPRFRAGWQDWAMLADPQLRLDAVTERVAGRALGTPAALSALVPCRLVAGIYQVCTREDGAVDAAEPVVSVPGADGEVLSALAGWRFRPSPVRQCFRMWVPFTVDGAMGCPAYRPIGTEPVAVEPANLAENQKGGVYLRPSWPAQAQKPAGCETAEVSYRICIQKDGTVGRVEPLRGFAAQLGLAPSADGDAMALLFRWRYRRLAFPVCVVETFRVSAGAGGACGVGGK